mgnify:CR=1 FL=1
MTEKQLEELANRVANKVIKAMEDKQDEFDEEFAKSIEVRNGGYRILSKKEVLEKALEDLREELSEYIKDEDYIKADKIAKEIDKIVKKLKNK